MKNLNSPTIIMMVAAMLVSSSEASSLREVRDFAKKNGAIIAGGLVGAVVGVAVLAKKKSAKKTTPPKSPEVVVAPKKTATAKTVKPAQSLFARSKAWVKNNPGKTAGMAAGVVGVVAAGVGAKHYFASSIPSEAGLNPAEQPEALVTPSSNQTQAQNGTNGTTSELSTPTPWTNGQIAGLVTVCVGVPSVALGCYFRPSARKERAARAARAARMMK